MSLPDDAIEIIERAFAASSYAYRTITMPKSKRPLRVIEAVGTPDSGLTAYVSYDGLLVEWDGVKAGRRILPIVPVIGGTNADACFHAAYLLDWALSKGVPPKPGDIVLSLGHRKEVLPHIRFDFPFPWETEKPFEIAVGDLVAIPVMAYSVSDAEAKLQHEEGSKMLERHFETKKVKLFDRDRADSIEGSG